MEKAAAGTCAGSRRVGSLGRIAALALGCCAICPPGWAQDAPAPQGLMVAEARTDNKVRLEVNTSAVPRLDNRDTGSQGPRLDVSALPAGGSGLGLAVGMTGFSGGQPAMLLPGSPAQRGTMDVGVRWRQPVGRGQVDVTAWRRMSDESPALVQQPTYGARVEMKLDHAKPGLDLTGGFVGVQLQGGAKISIKRKNGAPMVYYRSSF
jgi:hypothetical protein